MVGLQGMRKLSMSRTIVLHQVLIRYGYIFILSFVAFLAYIESIHIGFIADDFTFLKHGFGIDSVDEFLRVQFEHGRLIPVHILYFTFATYFFDMNPVYYHLVNIVVHFCCGLLGYHIVLRLTNRWSVSLISAILFVAFYKSSSQVVWITNMHGLTVSFWYLATTLLFMYWLDSDRRRFYYLALLTFGLALITKEEAITLLPTLIAIQLIRKTSATPILRNIKPVLFTFSPFLLFLVGYLLTHSWLSTESNQSHVGLSVLMSDLSQMATFLNNIVQNFKWFVTLLFLPEFMYGHPDHHALIKYGLIGIKIILIPGLGLLLWLKGDRAIRFFLVFICFSMSLYLMFTVAPRYVYLPSFGTSGLMAYLLILGLEKMPVLWHRFRAPIFGLILSFYLVVNIQETSQVIQRWQYSSNIIIDFRSQLRALKPNMPSHSRLGFINVPESGKPYVYALHTGLDAAVEFEYQDPTLNSFRVDNGSSRAREKADYIFNYRDGVLSLVEP